MPKCFLSPLLTAHCGLNSHSTPPRLSRTLIVWEWIRSPARVSWSFNPTHRGSPLLCRKRFLALGIARWAPSILELQLRPMRCKGHSLEASQKFPTFQRQWQEETVSLFLIEMRLEQLCHLVKQPEFGGEGQSQSLSTPSYFWFSWAENQYIHYLCPSQLLPLNES